MFVRQSHLVFFVSSLHCSKQGSSQICAQPESVKLFPQNRLNLSRSWTSTLLTYLSSVLQKSVVQCIQTKYKLQYNN